MAGVKSERKEKRPGEAPRPAVTLPTALQNDPGPSRAVLADIEIRVLAELEDAERIVVAALRGRRRVAFAFLVDEAVIAGALLAERGIPVVADWQPPRKLKSQRAEWSRNARTDSRPGARPVTRIVMRRTPRSVITTRSV